MNILVLATTVTILCVGYIESMLRIGQLTDEEVAAIEDLLNNGEDNIDDMINIDIMPPPITHIIHRSINSIIKLKIKYHFTAGLFNIETKALRRQDNKFRDRGVNKREDKQLEGRTLMFNPIKFSFLSMGALLPLRNL